MENLKSPLPILTISIPTWNRAGLLKNLLNDLTSTIKGEELVDKINILVSNNASNDETKPVALSFSSVFPNVFYRENKTNLGGTTNILQSMQFAETPFVIFSGDDDIISPGALVKILSVLEMQPDVGLFLDISGSKYKHKYTNNQLISFDELTRDFFYYMGNATLFISRSDYYKEFVETKGYGFFNQCWGQSQIILLGLNKYSHKICVNNIGVATESEHSEFTIYNSYYLWRGRILDLYLSAKDLLGEMPKTFKKNVFDNLSSDIFTNTMNILQFGLFIDDTEQRKKTRYSIRNNFFALPNKFRFYLFVMLTAFYIPLPISRVLGKLFVRLIRGKSGINDLNALISRETAKKKKNSMRKDSEVRKMEFEKD